MRKRVLAAVIAAAVICVLASCGRAKSADGADNSESESRLIKVGIINSDPVVSAYLTANDNYMKAMFSEGNGYDASFAYTMRSNEQIAAARKFIRDGVKYLIISAVDANGWEPVLQEAQTKGIRVILFDCEVNADPDLYEASVVTDMVKEGQQAVDWLLGQGLSEYNVIHLQGLMGTAAQQGRTAAMDAAAADGKVNVVIRKTGERDAGKAQEIVQAVIDAGTPFNVIYAENDNLAKGAVDALDASGISHGVGGDVIIMGFDCNSWALTELLEQNWNYDGQRNPFQAGCVDEVIRLLESGQTPEQKIMYMEEKGFDAATITQEDVDRYGI